MKNSIFTTFFWLHTSRNTAISLESMYSYHYERSKYFTETRIPTRPFWHLPSIFKFTKKRIKIYKNLKSPYISILLDYALRIIANIFQDLQNRRQLFRNFYLQFMLIKENQNFYFPVVLLFSWAFCILQARILFLSTSAKWKYCSITTDVWLLRQATGEFFIFILYVRPSNRVVVIFTHNF